MIQLTEQEKETILNITKEAKIEENNALLKFIVKEDNKHCCLLNACYPPLIAYDLNAQQKEIILGVAAKTGCDRDGDVLRLLVRQETKDIVVMNELLAKQMLNSYYGLFGRLKSPAVDMDCDSTIMYNK